MNMKKFLMVALALSTLTLGGCASGLAEIENAWSVVSSTTVPASYAIVTANAYDAIAAGATQYLKYCATNLTQTACSADSRRAVIKNVRAGRSIRNQIESYVTTSTTVPAALYNSLSDIVALLNSTP